MRPLLKLVLVASFLSGLSAPNTLAQDSSLVLHLLCDGTAKDASMYGNDGSALGPVPTTDRFGRPNHAYWFDGDGSKIVIQNSPSINPSNQLTITFWANLDGMTDNYLDVLYKGGPVVGGFYGNREYALYLKENLGAAYFLLMSAGDGQGQHESDSYSLLPRQWLFFTGIIDRKNHLMHVYINGQESTLYNQVDSYSSFNTNSYELWIGAGAESLYQHRSYKGALDDIRLYRRALSETEILALYREPQDALPHLDASQIHPFGHVLVGRTDTQVMSIRNRGTSPLIVSHIRSSNPAFHLSDSILTVPAFDFATVTVSYTPTIAVRDTGRISLVSNDPDSPETQIPVAGIGFVPGSAPVVLSIRDIPADQGHQVRILWFRSKFDGLSDSLHATYYDIWRQVEERPSAWDFVSSVPASHLDEYGLIASTIFDSSEIGGMHWSVLKVSARFRELIDPVFSSPDSGYSADNVIPSKVAGAFATLPGGQSVLRWDPVTDLDIDHYEIYASNTVTTSLSGMTLLGKAFSPVYLDNTYLPGSNRFYRVAAVDKDGNIGIPSDVVSVQTTSTQADRELLAAFALEQNYPNPFNPSTLIHYTIPKEAYVSLKVYDLLGREVAVLVHDKKAPGSYAETWDASGMASGVYVCRLRSGDFVQSRRMLLLR